MKSSSPSSAQWMSSSTSDQRVAGRHALEEPPPRLEQVLAAHAARVAGADERADLRRHLVVAEQLPHRGVRLLRGDLGRVVLEDLALRLDRVGEGRVRRVAVGEAAAAAPVDDLRQAFDEPLELRDQPGLPDARRPDDRDERGAALGLDAMEGLLQDRELLVAADEPRLQAEVRPLAAVPRLDPERLPRGHGLGLALEVERLELAVVDDVLGARVDGRADDDPARVRPRSAGARRCSRRRRSASGRAGPLARSRSTSTSPASIPIRISSVACPRRRTRGSARTGRPASRAPRAPRVRRRPRASAGRRTPRGRRRP